MFNMVQHSPTELINWERTEVSSVASFTLDVVKDWINRPREDTTWDVETGALMTVALRAIEAHAEINLAPSTWEGQLSQLYQGIKVTRRPFRSIESIKVVAEDGEIVTVPATQYVVTKAPQFCGLISFGQNLSIPTVAQRPDAVRIVCKTGFFTTADPPVAFIPDDMLHALKMLVADLDRSRGDEEGGGGKQPVFAMKNQRPGFLPDSIRMLIGPYIMRRMVTA
jgi:hypothetical protein